MFRKPERATPPPRLVHLGRCSTILPLCVVLLLLAGVGATATEPSTIAVVIGAAGQPEYGEQFRSWADRWEQAAEDAGASFHKIGAQDETNGTDREALRQFLLSHAEDDGPLWLILIGHGTFYRDTANFNLRGPDVSSKELAKWLEDMDRQLVVVNCSSSSGPFVRDLSAEGRVVITATQSGAEQNYARFGDYFSAAISDQAADLDHDKQISLLEAFLTASGRVAQFYEDEARLATEHALLEDNGDGLGTSADFYRGVRPAHAARDDTPLDGRLAARIVLIPSDIDRDFTPEQLERRAALEQEIDRLRARKADLEEEAYYEKLEPLMIQLARLYNEVERSGDDESMPPPVDAPQAK